MSETIYQGDTVALNYTIDNRGLSDNWRCRIQVKRSAADDVLQSQELSLNAGETAFIGQLPTVDLLPGSYFVYAQLDNAVTAESVELHNRLVVRQQGFTSE
jgi:hypothetical protein